MTENRRIVLNIAATYGRSLFGLAAGFLISRWVLQSLGTTDFGLFGVVGGIMAFVGFVNRTLAMANGRFYAVSVGACRSADDAEAALEECRRWFNAAIVIHVVVPLVLIAVGYPIGAWLIKNWLTVPPDRVGACLVAFRFACLASFLGMLSVPYLAMYGAKQEIAESTAISLVGTVSMLVLAWYMQGHPGDWMERYAAATCVIATLPTLLMVVRAAVRYPECKVRGAYMLDMRRIWQILSYAGWTLLAVVSILLRTDGIVILINKAFGPSVNAAYSIANQVEGKSEMFNGSLKGAFAPALTQAYGAGDLARMRSLALGMCKFGLLSSLVFMLPLALEVDEVMRIWLVNPPEFAAGLCVISILYHIVGMSTQGFDTAVGATGRIAKYLIISSGVALATLPVVGLVVWSGGGVYAMAWSLASMIMVYSAVRVAIAAGITGMSIREWARRIVMPTGLVAGLALACAAVPRFTLQPGWIRLALVVGVSTLVFVPLAWRLALDAEERVYVREKLLRKLGLCR